MSEENVDLVRSYFAALSGSDADEMLGRIEPVLQALGPDFEVDLSRSISPERGIYRGPEEIRNLFRVRADAWSRLQSFETELIDAGDIVIRVGGFRGTGKHSGIELSGQGATLWIFQNGKPVSMCLYQSRAEALEAAGLSDPRA